MRFTPFKSIILNIKIYMHVNSPACADENELKCENVRFLSEMSKLTQDELFSFTKRVHILRVYFVTNDIPTSLSRSDNFKISYLFF